MYLAVTLNRLDDFENACSAYEKAIDMEEDHLFELNYAITLYNSGNEGSAKDHYATFRELFDAQDEEARGADPDVQEQSRTLAALLGVE